ncbi:MAG: N-acetylmuramoyl-L-alanine amidase [Planctomycetota bacterium]
MGLVCLLGACRSVEPGEQGTQGMEHGAAGQEIVICGQRVPIGVRVVLWDEPEGFNAYSTEPSQADPEKAQVTEAERKLRYQPGRVERGGGKVLVPPDSTDMRDLYGVVDQFVLHYDVAGSSERCFRILHDRRGLSVHFLLDVDGTLYQTLDVRDQAWHATKANPRSVGIEIAQIGARGAGKQSELQPWYARDEVGLYLTAPAWARSVGPLAGDTRYRPARDDVIDGHIHGQHLWQYDFTPEQYRSLECLAAGLCRALPDIAPDAPRDPGGEVALRKLSDPEFAAFHGILGHFHVQGEKIDPGPAFQWQAFLEGVQARLARP